MGFVFGRVFCLRITVASDDGFGEKSSEKTNSPIVKSINAYLFFSVLGGLLTTRRVQSFRVLQNI